MKVLDVLCRRKERGTEEKRVPLKENKRLEESHFPSTLPAALMFRNGSGKYRYKQISGSIRPILTGQGLFFLLLFIDFWKNFLLKLYFLLFYGDILILDFSTSLILKLILL